MVLTELVRDCEMGVEIDESFDAMLLDTLRGVRVYSDRQLDRKIRLERERMPELEETAVPEVVVNYLTRQQMKLLVESARLTRFQAALLALVVDGWSVTDISAGFGIPYEDVRRRLKCLRRKIEKGHSPYAGLYEVYWLTLLVNTTALATGGTDGFVFLPE